MTLTKEMVTMIDGWANDHRNMEEDSVINDILQWCKQPILTGEEVAIIAELVELEEGYNDCMCITDPHRQEHLNNILIWVRGQ